MRDKAVNRDAWAMFGGMSPKEVQASARKVTEIPNDEIREAVKAAGSSEELAQLLIARKRDIARKVGVLAKEGPGGFVVLGRE
jgi:hypothetical protein